MICTSEEILSNYLSLVDGNKVEPHNIIIRYTLKLVKIFVHVIILIIILVLCPIINHYYVLGLYEKQKLNNIIIIIIT